MYDPIDFDFSNSWYTFFGTSSYTHAFPLLKTTSKVFDLVVVPYCIYHAGIDFLQVHIFFPNDIDQRRLLAIRWRG